MTAHNETVTAIFNRNVTCDSDFITLFTGSLKLLFCGTMVYLEWDGYKNNCKEWGNL